MGDISCAIDWPRVFRARVTWGEKRLSSGINPQAFSCFHKSATKQVNSCGVCLGISQSILVLLSRSAESMIISKDLRSIEDTASSISGILSASTFPRKANVIWRFSLFVQFARCKRKTLFALFNSSRIDSEGQSAKNSRGLLSGSGKCLPRMRFQCDK